MRTMKLGGSIVLALGLVVCLGASILLLKGTGTERVYSASAIQAGLVHNPSAWIGRTVLVHGAIVAISTNTPCRIAPCTVLGLSDSVRGQSRATLWLDQGAAEESFAFLRALPFANLLLPRHKLIRVSLGSVATFRVLLAWPTCNTGLCVRGSLLDTAPLAGGTPGLSSPYSSTFTAIGRLSRGAVLARPTFQSPRTRPRRGRAAPAAGAPRQ